MNHEMMTYQARQDFIDMHKDLAMGKQVSIERYDQISRDLKKLDDLNFSLMLEFVEKTDHLPIREMWDKISTYIEDVKRKGGWRDYKGQLISWKDGKIVLFHSS